MPALLWVFIPVYRHTDEASHVAYARELSHGRLPTIETPISSDGDPRLERVLRRRDDVHRTIWTANHPPLYYALAAVPLRIGSAVGRPTVGVAATRLLSIGLSAAGLAVLAYLVLQLVPQRPQLAVAATGLAALLPSFIDASSAAYNDSLAFLTSTLALAASVVFVLRGPSFPRLAMMAAFAGLAALTRASGLLVVGIAGLAVLVGVWRATEGSIQRRLGRAVVWGAAVGAVVIAAAGWFYARNLMLYGDMTGSAALFEQFDRSPSGTTLGLLTEPGFWQLLQQRLWGIAFNRSVPGEDLIRQLWLLGYLPLIGLLLTGARRLGHIAQGRGPAEPGPGPEPGPDPEGRVIAVGLCVLLLGLTTFSIAQFASGGGTVHIRYLFPALATVGLCAAVGLAALPGGRRGLPTVGVLLILGVVNLGARWQYFDVLQAPKPPLLLAVLLAPLLLVGIGSQAFAMWHLAPATTSVTRQGTPAGQQRARVMETRTLGSPPHPELDSAGV
jgi:hypothetical protein